MIRTEKPRTFHTIDEGSRYHKEENLTGWFIVNNRVYWCYASGIWSMTNMAPSDLVTQQGQPAVNIFQD